MNTTPLGVCIVCQSVSDSQLVDPSVFERAGNYRVKVALKSSADIIFSRSGHVVAFDLFNLKDLMGGQPAALARISKLGSTFKDAFAIIRMSKFNQHERNAVQAISCRISCLPLSALQAGQFVRFCGKPAVIAIPSEIDTAMLILKLTETHVSASACSTLNQDEYTVQGQSAVKESLVSVLHLDLSEHQASALCMLGSLQHIASSSVAEILDATDLDHAQAQQVVNFFQYPTTE